MAQQQQRQCPPWLELPDPCLLAVLRCCAAINNRTLLNAARAHSRLRQAAVVVGLDSIDAGIREQQQMESLQLYLSKHGQHVRSISLKGVVPNRSPIPVEWYLVTTLRELPANLPRLRSVSFTGRFFLQLQPGNGHMGVLGSMGAHLQRLGIHNCVLLDGEQGLAAALAQLPRLEHLSMSKTVDSTGGDVYPPDMLQQLTQVGPPWWVEASQWAGALQHLTALSRLAELRLVLGPATVTAAMLAGAQCLTRLQLQSGGWLMSVEPAVLAGMTQLQHLELFCDLLPDGSAGTAELLRQLQHLQQLTALVVPELHATRADSPRLAAFSALTASSKLRSLGFHNCTLPAGVWQHVFPAGRQLMHLRTLDASRVDGTPGILSVPDGSRLVSCCPGLQTLRVHDVPDTADLKALAQLSGLRALYIFQDRVGAGRLPQLTRLQQLTLLHFGVSAWTLESQAPGDEPVWRQLLRHYLQST